MNGVVRAEPVEALNYAMFGNNIEFHNHQKAPNALVLNSSIYSNSTIEIDKAVSISGPTQAVNTILPNFGPASGDGTLPNTFLSPDGRPGSGHIRSRSPGPTDGPGAEGSALSDLGF